MPIDKKAAMQLMEVKFFFDTLREGGCELYLDGKTIQGGTDLVEIIESGDWKKVMPKDEASRVRLSFESERLTRRPLDIKIQFGEEGAYFSGQDMKGYKFNYHVLCKREE